MIRLLVVGKDNFKYNRTAVLLSGLIAHPEVDLKVHTLKTKSRKEGSVLSLLTKDFDYAFVPAFRHTDMGFVKRWSQVPVIFDPLISKFMTKVIDYKHYHKLFKYIIDYRAFHHADLLIADTEAHRDYYNRMFNVPLTKSLTLPVGVNTDEFKPSKLNLELKSESNAKFVVGFYGSFNPLQGTSVIMEAARLLLSNEEIVFKIIGTGYEYKAAQNQIKSNKLINVELVGWVQQDCLKKEIDKFDLCLGIFGSSLKADSVVPNKIYHYAALGKAILTKDTSGIREIFDESSLELIKAKSEDLSQSILKLKDDDRKRKNLGQNALNVIQGGYTHHHIAQLLVDRMKSGI